MRKKEPLPVELTVATLWSDTSNEAKKLIIELVLAGYPVKHIFTGSLQPTISFGKCYYTGYTNIRLMFNLLRR